MVALDCYRRKRNLNAAWIDVRKAYDTIDHRYLVEVLEVHGFPNWLIATIKNLCRCWNTRVAIKTKNGNETSNIIWTSDFLFVYCFVRARHHPVWGTGTRLKWL